MMKYTHTDARVCWNYWDEYINQYITQKIAYGSPSRVDVTELLRMVDHRIRQAF